MPTCKVFRKSLTSFDISTTLGHYILCLVGQQYGQPLLLVHSPSSSTSLACDTPSQITSLLPLVVVVVL